MPGILQSLNLHRDPSITEKIIYCITVTILKSYFEAIEKINNSKFLHLLPPLLPPYLISLLIKNGVLFLLWIYLAVALVSLIRNAYVLQIFTSGSPHML